MLRHMLAAALEATTIGMAAAAQPTPVIGAPARPFEFTTMDGDKTSLAALRGKVVLINIWATWCAPCKAEMPLLDAYYRLQRDAGLRVYAVTTEDSVPIRYLRKLNDALEIPLVSRMRGDYGPLKGVPTNYIIDRHGVLRYARSGAFTLDELNALLPPLLSEPGPADSASAPAVAGR